MKLYWKQNRADEIKEVSNNVVCKITSGEYSDLEITQIVNSIKNNAILYLNNRNQELTTELHNNVNALRSL